jgi:RNA-directed DNA polymerase
VLEQQVLPQVERFLAERGLTLSREKTCLTQLTNGVNFLGQQLRKYARKLLITPAKKNLEAVLTKIRQVIKTHAAATAAQVIQRLNPMIRGWANYHRHIAAKATFYRVDVSIQNALWRWAQRRHRQQSARWIRQKYFPAYGRGCGVFSGTLNDRTVTRRRASEVKIVRRPTIERRRNPYDLADRAYFAQRNERHRYSALSKPHGNVWKRQQGKCPVCGEFLTEERDRHLHHQDGNHSNNGVLNLVMLHANCHRQVHSQEFDVTKPRLETGVRSA